MGTLYALMLLAQSHQGRVLPLVTYHMEVVQTGTGVAVAVVADTVWTLPQPKAVR